MMVAMLGTAACGSSASDDESPAAPTSAAPPASSSPPVSGVDPSTLEGGCEIVFGDEDLLKAALKFPKSKDEAERARIQERLFSIVSAKNESLGDAAGQLVDYLDDPSAYIENGKPVSSISVAISDIRETCDSL
jgi:hypothetical protein